jgi:hypothetical protein
MDGQENESPVGSELGPNKTKDRKKRKYSAARVYSGCVQGVLFGQFLTMAAPPKFLATSFSSGLMDPCEEKVTARRPAGRLID